MIRKEVAITGDTIKGYTVVLITNSKKGDTLSQSQTTKQFITIENTLKAIEEFYKNEDS